MRIIIDADACPVTNDAINLARLFSFDCVIVSDESRRLQHDEAESIFVPVGVNSVDYAIIGMINPDDILITNDAWLAEICDNKGVTVLNFLAKRYSFKRDKVYAVKLRRSKKSKPRTKLFDLEKRRQVFRDRFEKLLSEKRLSIERELELAKQQRYFDKLTRREERRQQVKLDKQQSRQKPPDLDIVSDFFWNDVKRTKRFCEQTVVY